MSNIVISKQIADTLPSTVKQGLASLSEHQQSMWEEEYKRKARSPGLMLALAILFPIQFFIEGRVGLGILFLLTAGGLWVWWIADIFMVWGRTKAHNEEVARTVLRDIKAFG